MARLTEFERGMLMSSMADTSVARTLGRSLRWVVRVRGVLDVDPEPALEPVQARVGQSVEAWEAEQVAAEMPAPTPAPTPAAPTVEPKPAPRRLKAPAIPPRQRARPIPGVRTEGLNAAGAVTVLRPLKPRVVEWAWWFVAAGWPLEEVADLFDLAADRLEAALADREVSRAA